VWVSGDETARDEESVDEEEEKGGKNIVGGMMD